MKGIKKFFTIAIVFLIIGGLGSFLLLNNYNKNKQLINNLQPINLSMPDIQEISKKIKVTDVLVENIVNKKELITMEADLIEEIVWDDSFTEWEIFKKTQKLRFTGKGKYSTDLSTVTKDDIDFNIDTKKITIKINKPIINSIEIIEEKIEVYDEEKGLFRFGKIKLTALEQKEIYKKVKLEMTTKLQEEELENEAEEKTKIAVKEIFEMFLLNSNINNYEVVVEFK